MLAECRRGLKLGVETRRVVVAGISWFAGSEVGETMLEGGFGPRWALSLRLRSTGRAGGGGGFLWLGFRETVGKRGE